MATSIPHASHVSGLPGRSGLAGRFLCAMPQLDGGPFAQSVVLICSHDEEHAFGLVVNKPISGLSLADIVGEMGMTPGGAMADRAVHFGGPVDMQRGALLHSLDYMAEDTLLIGDAVGLTATKDVLAALNEGEGPRDAVLFMGHAGWDAGQLDDEIKNNVWIDADMNASLIFGKDTGRAWHEALSSVGTDEAMLSAVALGEGEPLPN